MSDYQLQRASVRQLAYRIKGSGESPVPRFAFFLGAGASVESGIPLAGDMIGDFCRRIIQEQCPESYTDGKQQQAWLEQQEWYVEANQKGTLYSDAFERHEQKERGRQLYIEGKIAGKKPSLGYVVLANLMARNYINTVLTTNFDDLVYEACSTFTDIRPVVYAYGTMVSDLRVTNARPRILKLHGDYLYSKLKNSNQELAHQDPNMSRHVPILLNEYGLVVVGYSGCDKSVMDLLSRFSPDNDLYWCGRAGSPIPDSVQALLRQTNGCLIEIQSFDHMMNEIRSVAGFDVPKMLGSLEARQDRIIEQLKTFPTTFSGMTTLLREVYEFRRNDAAELKKKGEKEEAFLHYINAHEAWQKGDFEQAESEFRASLRLNAEDLSARLALAGALCQWGKYSEAEEEIKTARSAAPVEQQALVASQLAYLLMVQECYAESLNANKEVIELDPQNAVAYNGLGVAHMHLRQFDEAASAFRTSAGLEPAHYYPAFNLASVLQVQGEQIEALEWWSKAHSIWQQLDPIDPYNHAIIEAALGNVDAALSEMGRAIREGQPGLARLALGSVAMLEMDANCAPVFHDFRRRLEAAIANS